MNREYTVEEFRRTADTLLALVPRMELATVILAPPFRCTCLPLMQRNLHACACSANSTLQPLTPHEFAMPRVSGAKPRNALSS